MIHFGKDEPMSELHVRALGDAINSLKSFDASSGLDTSDLDCKLVELRKIYSEMKSINDDLSKTFGVDRVTLRSGIHFEIKNHAVSRE